MKRSWALRLSVASDKSKATQTVRWLNLEDGRSVEDARWDCVQRNGYNLLPRQCGNPWNVPGVLAGRARLAPRYGFQKGLQ